MFNRSNRPVIIASEEQLPTLVEAALRDAIEEERLARSGRSPREHGRPFEDIIQPLLGCIADFRPDDLDALFDLACLDRTVNHGVFVDQDRVTPQMLSALRVNSVSLRGLRNTHRSLRYAFLRLWSRRAAMLPVCFPSMSIITLEQRRRALLPTATVLLEDGIQQQHAQVMFRLVCATTWFDFANIDIDEIGEFHRFVIDDANHAALNINFRYPPFVDLIRQFADKGPGFGYTRADAQMYKYWITNLRFHGIGKPSEFFPQAAGWRDGKATRRTKVLLTHRRKLRLGADATEAGLLAPEVDDAPTATEVTFREFAANDTDAGAEAYFCQARQLHHKFRRAGTYPGIDHPIPDSWTIWERCIAEWQRHRVKMGREQDDLSTFTNVLRDYLCLYLPWWRHLHGDDDIEPPPDPSRFDRFGWWVDDGGGGHRPRALLDLATERLGHAGTRVFVGQAQVFFEYCVANAPRLRLSRREFVCPVVGSQDRPYAGRQRNKTSKVPFRKDVFPLLLRYAYECERLGMHMQRLSADGVLGAADDAYIRHAQARGVDIDPGRWGFDSAVVVGDRTYSVPSLPLILNWEDRRILVGGSVVAVRVPHLTSLRLTMAAMETGLRFQAIQWLDRRSFDTENSGRSDDDAVRTLLVNTDKVKSRPWTTLVLKRAQDILLRELAFQESIDEAGMADTVPYEGRPHSRFGEVQPLFRSHRSPGPVTDARYRAAWELLLVSFANWFNTCVRPDEPVDIYRLEAVVDRVTGERVTRHVKHDAEYLPYSPLVVRLVHTPHSARATYATHRSTLLPVEDIAQQIGHGNTATTVYYTVHTEEDLANRLIEADAQLWAPDPDNPVHVRADQVTSALRQSFLVDREKTATAFGFRTVSLLSDEAEAENNDGIALLRSRSMAEIVFRETHICPVGECCPTDVMEAIVEPRRCGLCPIAVKSVDHMPAITAKMRRLIEQVREGSILAARMVRRDEPAATVEEINAARRLDIMEYEAWKTTLASLGEALSQLAGAGDLTFQAGKPEAVRLHLRVVAREADVAEFITSRMTDSSVMPSMETAALRSRAAQVRQRLMVSDQALVDELYRLDDDDPIAATLAGLRSRLATLGLEPTYSAVVKELRHATRSLSDQREARSTLPATVRGMV